MTNFGTKLKLVLWKNLKLQMRNKLGLFFELFSPLILFMIVAFVRSTRDAIEVPDLAFAAQALPSAGVPVFLQSILCGGVPFCDDDDYNAQTALGKAILIMREDPDLTPDRLVSLLDNATQSINALNRTLDELGLSNTTDLRETLIDLDLIDRITDNITNTVNGRFTADTFAVEQDDFRQLIRVLCRLIKSEAYASLLGSFGNSSEADANFETFRERLGTQLLGRENTALDFNKLINSDDVVNELLAQLRSTPAFVDTFVPRLLETRYGVDSNTVSQVQDILRNSGNISTDAVREQLQTLTNLNTTVINALVGAAGGAAAIGGGGGVSNINTSALPDALSPIAELAQELDWLNRDLAEIEAAERVLNKIWELPEIKTLITDIEDGTDVMQALQNALCPSVMGNTCHNDMPFYDNEWEQSGGGGGTTTTNKTTGGQRRRRRQQQQQQQQHQTLGGGIVDGRDQAHQFVSDVWLNAARGLRDRDHDRDHDRVRDRRDDGVATTTSSPTSAPTASSDPFSGASSFTSMAITNVFSNLTIFYAPRSTLIDAIIKTANQTFDELETLQQLYYCISTANAANSSSNAFNSSLDKFNETFNNLNDTWQEALNSPLEGYKPFFNFDAWQGFDTIEEMRIAAIARPASDLVAAIEFDNVNMTSGELEYSIRMNYRKTPETNKYTVRYARAGTGGNSGALYYYSGFVWIQDMIDRAFTDLHADNEVALPPSFLRLFPVPAYRRDNFANAIGSMFPLLMTLAWIYTVAMVCKSIVHEKETRLKEYMKIMGMGSGVHWLGWFISKLLVITITVAMLCCILIYGKVIANSSMSVVFVLLELFGVTTLIFSFLMSTFFNKARLASATGGILYFVFYLPYIFVRQNREYMSRGAIMMASTLSTTAFGLSCDYIGKFEEAGMGIQWSNLRQGLNECDNFSMADAMWMMVFDCVWMGLLTLYIEAVWPGEYGIPLPWYFLVQPSYWKKTKAKDTTDISDSTEVCVSGKKEFEEAPPGTKGISIRHLTKKYNSNDCHVSCLDGPKSETIAVDDVNLDMLEGSITSLLGHNGAGKTTTMSMLCGLFPPTSGTAIVSGYDIRTDMSDVRSSLGICPQYNVLFELLTVYECLWFCARLKGMAPKDIKADILQFLEDLGFEDKIDVYTKNLSGGMKRKLSVAMAFIGGSKVIILDEPTAGMDPSARRSTWDLLLRYKQDRTIMLTTHHMDEADLLSDRIAIIAKGVVRCIGSSLFLKSVFGAGYTVTLSLDTNADVKQIDDVVKEAVPNAALSDTTDQERSYILPCLDQPLYSNLFEQLQNAKEAIGVKSYGITATSLEEVFIKVAEMADDDEVKVKDNTVTLNTDGDTSVSVKGDVSVNGDVTEDVGMLGETISGATPSTKLSNAASPAIGTRNTGAKLWFTRFRALMVKRMQHAVRDRKSVLAQILLPGIFVMMGMWVATAFPPPEDLPALNLHNMVPLQQSCAAHGGKSIKMHVPYANLDNVTYADDLAQAMVHGVFEEAMYKNLSDESAFVTPLGTCGADCSYSNNMTSYLLDTYDEKERFRRIAMSLEEAHDPSVGFSVGDFDDVYTLTAHAWYDNRAYHAAPISLGLINNMILGANTNSSSFKITTKNFPLNKTSEDLLEQYVGSLTDLVVAINVIIALSFVPASFVLFLVQERESKAKHLQLVSGAQPLCYWLANYAWDSINFLLPVGVCLIVFAVYELPAYTGRNFPAVVVLMLLYGWSITPAMYPFNYLFKVPSTAYVTLIVANLFVGLTCTLTTTVLELFQDDDPELYEIGLILNKVFLIFPQFCLGRGLIAIAKNEYISQFQAVASQLVGNDKIKVEFRDPFHWDIAGEKLTAMAAEIFGFFLLTLIIEYVSQRNKKFTGNSKTPDTIKDESLSTDVIEEQQRLISDGADDDVLRVKGLTKVYKSRGKSKKAVDNLYFGVPKGQCFGLLGVNGAGKTSTFKMLTGDIGCTDGDAWVAGHTIRGEGVAVKQNLGYCPQFDALDPFLTGRQTLVLYARLRGICEANIGALVDWTVTRLQLGKWADRITREYSGGNKRKLSVAIGIIGDPPVLFLDEPTSGMDPRARRFLWDMITANVRKGRCVILTSHSMEECDALCNRLAIMVNGQFQCIGSPQHLKNVYGDGYSLVMKVEGRDPEVDPVKTFVNDSFAGAELKECHHGYIRYHLPRENLPPLSQIFLQLEQHKTELKLEDYSISQTSLDEIFCNFAKLQDSDRTAKVRRSLKSRLSLASHQTTTTTTTPKTTTNTKTKTKTKTKEDRKATEKKALVMNAVYDDESSI